MKKIIVTEEQLRNMMEDMEAFTYLDKDNMNYQEDKAETNQVADALSTKEVPDNITMDRLAKTRAPKSFYGYRGGLGAITCSTDKNGETLNETNKDAENVTFTLPRQIWNILNSYNQKGWLTKYPRIAQVAQSGKIDFQTAMELRNDINSTGMYTTAGRLMGGKTMYDWLNQQLQNAQNNIKNDKQISKNLGNENAFNKAHTRDANLGQGHSGTFSNPGSTLTDTKSIFGN